MLQNSDTSGKVETQCEWFGRPGNTACACQIYRVYVALSNSVHHPPCPIGPQAFSNRKPLSVDVGGENGDLSLQRHKFGSFNWQSAD